MGSYYAEKANQINLLSVLKFVGCYDPHEPKNASNNKLNQRERES